MRARIQRPTRQGFTLIELLVVVAIIALLISILLPSLKRAKDQAKQVVCGTHLRELYTAATEYATVNRDYYPRGIQGFGDGTIDANDEYNVFSSSILPFIGYDGKDRLWASAQSKGPNGNPIGNAAAKPIMKRLNKICLDFEVLHCTGFPVEYYDDPSDRRFAYHQSDEEAYGPSLINPMHFIASAMSMPYGPPSLAAQEGNTCWAPDAEMQGVSGPPGMYEETSQLESFPVECQPATKIYVTGVNKSVPWCSQNPGGGSGAFVGQRFNTMFLVDHLSKANRPRMGDDNRHPGGMNNMFFDGHVKALDVVKMDPGCEVELDERLSLFTTMYDGWEGWGP